MTLSTILPSQGLSAESTTSVITSSRAEVRGRPRSSQPIGRITGFPLQNSLLLHIHARSKIERGKFGEYRDGTERSHRESARGIHYLPVRAAHSADHGGRRRSRKCSDGWIPVEEARQASYYVSRPISSTTHSMSDSGVPETCDACRHTGGAVAEPDFRHPSDVALMEGRQELGGDEAVPGQASLPQRTRSRTIKPREERKSIL